MNNISTNLPNCPVCDMSKWGVELQPDGSVASYCTFCSGEYAHTQEARNAAAGNNE